VVQKKKSNENKKRGGGKKELKIATSPDELASNQKYWHLANKIMAIQLEQNASIILKSPHHTALRSCMQN